jgi:hypothetical protein
MRAKGEERDNNKSLRKYCLGIRSLLSFCLTLRVQLKHATYDNIFDVGDRQSQLFAIRNIWNVLQYHKCCTCRVTGSYDGNCQNIFCKLHGPIKFPLFPVRFPFVVECLKSERCHKSLPQYSLRIKLVWHHSAGLLLLLLGGTIEHSSRTAWLLAWLLTLGSWLLALGSSFLLQSWLLGISDSNVSKFYLDTQLQREPANHNRCFDMLPSAVTKNGQRLRSVFLGLYAVS